MKMLDRKISVNVLIEKVASKFWVLPMLVILFILALLPVSLQFDGPFKVFSHSSARDMLTTIATSLMTIIGVVSSLSIVVLQNASSQFSPRVIENFIRAISTQVMIGAYTGTFIFCLLLLNCLPPENSEKELPHLALLLSLGFSITCVAFLVHYVDHLANSIMSTNIVASIRGESLKFIKRFRGFIDEYKSPSDPGTYKYKCEIRVDKNGYYVSFLWFEIKKALHNLEAFIEIEKLTGDFIHKGDLIALVRSNIELTNKQKVRIQKALQIGNSRTHAQDTRYGLRQLVDMGLRGVSPGINDPSTTVECLNSIGVILDGVHEDEDEYETLKIDGIFLRFKQVTYDALLELAFYEIAHSGKDYKSVMGKIQQISEYLATKHPEKSKLKLQDYLSGEVD